MTQPTRLILGRLVTVLALGLAPGCDEDDGAHDGLRDAGADESARPDSERDAEPEAGEPDCYENPETYVEIINACTDAERVEKNPDLPQLLPDGALPPLP